jgi:hypothetical protein
MKKPMAHNMHKDALIDPVAVLPVDIQATSKALANKIF